MSIFMPQRLGSVTSLYRYPVKSMQGESIANSWADERGLLGDRAFAVVDCTTGKVASAKNPRLWKQLLYCRAYFMQGLSTGGPLPPVYIELPSGDTFSSEDPTTNQRSEYFGRPVELLRQARPASAYDDYWPDMDGLSPKGHRDQMTSEPISRFAPEGTFFDMAAFHILTQQSLEAARAAAPASLITGACYRPNIVIDCESAASAFVENEWPSHTLNVGASLQLRVLMSAMRCVMTTMDQPDLPNDPMVLRSLVSANMVDIPEIGKYPCAGVYAGLSRRTGTGGYIAVGDACFHDKRPSFMASPVDAVYPCAPSQLGCRPVFHAI